MHLYTTAPRFLAILLLALCGACSGERGDAALIDSASATPAPPAPVTAAPSPVAASPERPAPVPAPVVCATCGVVRSIVAVNQPGTGTGVGAALGAIVGGVAGNQVGGGSGRKIATVAGVIGGAVVGNNIEKNRRSTSYHEVTVDMAAGGQRFITVPDASGIRVGSAVEVQGSNIYLR